MIRVTTFAGQTVAVFGLGASGNATALALLAGGAEVAAWDDGAGSREAAAKAGVPIADLKTADWSRFAALVLAPGVPLTHPEPHWTVLRAKAAGIEVIGDIELFCRERAKVCPDAPFIAITGTNGKSTTTALIAHILRSAGLDVQMGGNIGRAILTLEPCLLAPSDAHTQPVRDRRFYVIEMSSFQIDLCPSLNPTIGVLLNITPDHLDRHGPADDSEQALQYYAAIKTRLVAKSMIAYIGIDDEYSERIARNIAKGPSAEVLPVSTRPLDWRPGVEACDGVVWLRMRKGFMEDGRIAAIDGIGTLRGAHNTQNAAFACGVTRSLGVNEDAIERGLRTYPGLPHRMEEVGRSGKVIFINDSKATNADSTDKALASWDRDIFWIVGGKPKEGGITPLAPYFPRVAKAYLIGQASDDFAKTLDAGKVAYERCGTLDVAVGKASADAAGSTGPEPVVLLSPACASYDQFKSFEHRGDAFRNLVLAMPDVTAKDAAKP